ncbi:unnamed protein product, partial [Rotaria sordida]
TNKTYLVRHVISLRCLPSNKLSRYRSYNLREFENVHHCYSVILHALDHTERNFILI